MTSPVTMQRATTTFNRILRSSLSHRSKQKFNLLKFHRSCFYHSTAATTSSLNKDETPPSYISGPTTHFGYSSIPTSEKESRVKEVFQNVSEKYDIMNDFMSFGIHRYWKDELCRMTYLESLAKALRRKNADDKDETLTNYKILDVAGGTGDVAFRFIESGGCLERSKSSGEDDIQITVCDINPSMLSVGEKRARERYGDEILDQTRALQFIEGNAEELPFEDNAFDLYTIAFGLRNVTDVDKALNDAHRVLKPGGRFMCLEFSQVENCELIRQIYDWYSFQVIPSLGKAVANDEESYKYLVESIRKFSSKKELKERMETAGFEGVKYTDMTFGIVSLHEGWKSFEI